VKKAAKFGLQFPERPVNWEEGLQFPENLADLTMKDLGLHLSYWTAMADYADVITALADAQKTSFEAAGKDRLMLLMRSSQEAKVTDKRTEGEADPDVRKYRLLENQYRAEFKVFDSIRRGYERKYMAVSRELERRKQEFGRAQGDYT